MIEPGTNVQTTYPVTTHVHRVEQVRRMQRNIAVRWMRDLVEEPLTVNEFMRRPFVSRSRWLAIAWDLDREKFRQFYLGNSIEFAAPGQLRFALYRPDETRPLEIVSRGFDPTVVDRRAMMRFIRDWPEQEDAVLRVVPDDVKLVA